MGWALLARAIMGPALMGRTLMGPHGSPKSENMKSEPSAVTISSSASKLAPFARTMNIKLMPADA